MGIAHYFRFQSITVSLSGNVFYWGIDDKLEIRAEHAITAMRRLVHDANRRNVQIAFMYY